VGPPVSLGQHFAGAPMPNSLMNKPADVADSNQIPDLPDLGGPIPKPWGSRTCALASWKSKPPASKPRL